MPFKVIILFLLNVALPIWVTEFGIITLISSLSPNAKSSIEITLVENSIDGNLFVEKAITSKVVTEFGITTFVNCLL